MPKNPSENDILAEIPQHIRDNWNQAGRELDQLVAQRDNIAFEDQDVWATQYNAAVAKLTAAKTAFSQSYIDAQKRLYGQLNPDIPAAKTGEWEDPTDGSRWWTEDGVKKFQMSGPISGFRPQGVPTPAAGPAPKTLDPRYPDEFEAAALQNEASALAIAKAKTDAAKEANPWGHLYDQFQGLVENLGARVRAKTLDSKKAEALIALAQENMEAALEGTTIHEKKVAADKKKYESASMGADYLSTRAQVGSGLYNSLMNQGTQAFGKILGSSMAKFPGVADFNPDAMSVDYTNRMMGGQGMADMATSLMQGYMNDNS
jgi:hypothetical protein